MECMLTGALDVAYSVSYLEYGWQLNCELVTQVILFTDGALLFWGNFFITNHTQLLSKMMLFILSDLLLPSARK